MSTTSATDQSGLSRHVGCVIAVPAADLDAYVRDVGHLPAWASGVAQHPSHIEGDELVIDNPSVPGGPVRVRFLPALGDGVLDHEIRTPDGAVVTTPMRVLEHPGGCEVTVTLRRAGMDDAAFEADAAWIAADLERLAEILETETGSEAETGSGTGAETGSEAETGSGTGTGADGAASAR